MVAALAAKASITKVDAEKFVNGFVATVEDVIPFFVSVIGFANGVQRRSIAEAITILPTM